MQNCGIIYGASNMYCLKQAIVSAKSFNNHMSGYPIILYVNSKELEIAALNSVCFDRIEILQEEGIDSLRSMKLRSVECSPFDRSLFIDTDTYLVDSIEEIFKLLDIHDMLLTLDTRDSNGLFDCKGQVINGPMPFNGGFIAYKKNHKTDALFSNWIANYKNTQHVYSKDQKSFFTEVIYSDLRTMVLPNNYNFRTPYPAILLGKVKLIHGHHSEREFIKIERLINCSNRLRVWHNKRIRIVKKSLIIRIKRRMKILFNLFLTNKFVIESKFK